MEILSKFGVVIPAYNEESRIGPVLRKIKKYIIPENIIVVDDGSLDKTSIVSRSEGVTVIVLEKNMGKGYALRTGFNYLLRNNGIKALLTIDSDGQHDPDEIPLFMEKFDRDKADIIIGNRMSDTSSMPVLRKITNRLTSRIISSIAGCRITDSQSGYRLIKCDLLRKLELRSDRFDAESEILIKAARLDSDITSVRTKTIYLSEESKIRPIQDSVRFFKLVIRSYFW